MEATRVLPSRPIERLTTPLERFLQVESSSGLVLFACTVTALALANSRLAPAYQTFWGQRLGLSLGGFALDYPLWYWVNDGLMTLFFFLIGLEIKRELISGELSARHKVVVPIAAAVGGALLPVLIFLALQHGEPGERGWAVPMATDIAFVVGGLALFGARVPRGLKVFLLSLAIVDDILAVAVIAAFYGESLAVGPLLAAFAGLGAVRLLDRAGVRSVPAYALVGGVIWLLTLKSGVHPTIAGVALGLLTPEHAWLGDRSFREVLAHTTRLVESDADDSDARRGALAALRFASREAIPPLERLEIALHPWVGFAIMPLFALANAGIAFDAGALGSPLALAIASGLVLGKPLGIVAASLLVVALRRGRLPEGLELRTLIAAGCLAGIGFTMSLFVASLGLTDELLLEAKSGVLIGSGISLVLGLGLMHIALPRQRADSGISPIVEPRGDG
jgi:NhaA family Na+:H+ antiporter